MRIITLILSTLFSPTLLPNPILDYYPKCDYKVIKERDFTSPIESKNSLADIDTAFAKIRKKIKKASKKVKSNAVILTEKKIYKPSDLTSKIKDKLHRIRYKAIFIQTCEPFSLDLQKPTSVSSDGYSVRELFPQGVGKTKLSFTLEPEKDEEKKVITLPNRLISPDAVYGIKLNTKKTDFLNQFGKSTSVFYGQNDVTILGYGRYHWFIFSGDQLVAITNKNYWFNQTLINTLPFLNSFDNNKWELKNIGKESGPIQTERLDEKHQLTFENDQARLIIDTIKDYSQYGYDERKLYKFTLYKKGFDISKIKFHPSLESSKLVSELLKSKENLLNSTYASKLLKETPVGKVNVPEHKPTYLFTPNAALTFSDSKLIKVVITESYLNQINISDWRWDKFTQNDPIEKVEALLPSDAFVLGSQITVEDTYTNETYLFDDTKEGLLLHTIEVDVFNVDDK